MSNVIISNAEAKARSLKVAWILVSGCIAIPVIGLIVGGIVAFSALSYVFRVRKVPIIVLAGSRQCVCDGVASDDLKRLWRERNQHVVWFCGQFLDRPVDAQIRSDRQGNSHSINCK